jgi:FkbM family methyltransferase
MKQFGIIVFGHRRKQHLRNVLESLKRQDVMAFTHVWIDGSSHASELDVLVKDCQSLKAEYSEANWQFHYGRLGIEKLMLDGLSFMARQYEKIIILEDDCFPTSNAVSVFLEHLTEIENDPTVYSVYGHHFETPNEGKTFSRFQGWGWATTRQKLIPVLSQLKAMFIMSEDEYLKWTDSALTPEIISKLAVTPGRDVVNVLRQQFSWDSASTLLTAILGLLHMKTSQKVIYNCGIGVGSGHFKDDSDFLRSPPYNMIAVNEVWQYFNSPLLQQYRGAKYFGLNALDNSIAQYIPQQNGIFVDVGANDGINQSNSLYFERLGWQCLLIEPVASIHAKCKLNRPLAQVVHAACVASDYPNPEISLIDVGLMSFVDGARKNEEDKKAWIQRGEQLQQITSERCLAPAKTLTSILEDQNLTEIDLLSVDVEGYESEVLAGLDFSRFRPKHIVIEDSGTADLKGILGLHGYEIIAVFNERQFTRDLLFFDRNLTSSKTS